MCIKFTITNKIETKNGCRFSKFIIIIRIKLMFIMGQDIKLYYYFINKDFQGIL